MTRKKINAQLEEILELIPSERQFVGEKLIEEIIFMQGTLTNLKEQIREHGEIERFEQGKQNFLRESPALKGYNSTVQRYSQLCKQLCDLLPKSAEKDESGALYDFLKRDI